MPYHQQAALSWYFMAAVLEFMAFSSNVQWFMTLHDRMADLIF